MAGTNPLEKFERLCDEVAQRWDQYRFVSTTHRETPAQKFGRVATVGNFREAINSGIKKQSPWASAVMAVAGTAFGVLGVATGIVIPGVIMTAVVGGGFGLHYQVGKKRVNQWKGDLKVAEKAFPQFQKDLDQILESAVDVAQSANRAYEKGTLSESQRRAAVSHVQGVLRQFSDDVLAIDDKTIRTGESELKGLQNDSRVIGSIQETIGQLNSLHSTTPRGTIQPPGTGVTRGVEHRRDPSRPDDFRR